MPIQRELWPLFVLLAILLLGLEGLLYWRRQVGGRMALPGGTGDRWALALRGALVVVLLVKVNTLTDQVLQASAKLDEVLGEVTRTRIEQSAEGQGINALMEKIARN